MVFQNNVLLGAAGSGTTTYAIDQSIRFNNYDTAYMKRTPSSSGNQRTWTLSMWVKRGELGNYGLFGTRTGNTTNFFAFEFNSDDLFVQGYASSSQTLRFETNAHFRDPSAWYNIQLVADTTNAVSTERIRIYVNGERVSSFATATYPTQNYDTHINSSSYENAIGCYDTGSDRVFSGYMTDIVMLDGTAADPSSFGETNSNGIWVPKDVSGLTFGTNGFHIDGRDSADLGDDESGQGNDYTAVNLAAHDQVSDSPTNNFATFNSVYADVTGFTEVTYKNGNLQADGTGSGQFDHTVSTYNLPKSGKWYFEHYLGGRYTGFGICIVGQEGTISSGYSFGTLSTSQGFGFQDNVVYNGNSATVTFGGQSSSGDILNCAFDVDNNKVFLGINGTYYAADNGDDGNPSAGTNPTVTTSFSLSTNDIILGFYFSTADGTSFVNFGQEGTFGGNKTAGGNSDANGIGNFFNTVPTNYLALCSKNVGG